MRTQVYVHTSIELIDKENDGQILWCFVFPSVFVSVEWIEKIHYFLQVGERQIPDEHGRGGGADAAEVGT